MSPNPRSMVAQVAGSGTPAAFLKTKLNEDVPVPMLYETSCDGAAVGSNRLLEKLRPAKLNPMLVQMPLHSKFSPKSPATPEPDRSMNWNDAEPKKGE